MQKLAQAARGTPSGVALIQSVVGWKGPATESIGTPVISTSQRFHNACSGTLLPLAALCKKRQQQDYKEASMFRAWHALLSYSYPARCDGNLPGFEVAFYFSEVPACS